MSRRSVYYRPNLAEKQAIRAALHKSTASRARAETIAAMRAALAANPPRAPTNTSRAASIATRRTVTNAPEMKHVDLSETNNIMTATKPAYVLLLNGVGTGNSNWNRIGNKISPISIDVDYCLYNMDSTTFQRARVALIWDKQPNPSGDFPDIGQIWADVEPSGNLFITPMSGRNYNYTDRFVCLASDEAFLYANNNNSGGKHMLTGRWIRSLRGLPCQYRATTTSLASISTGALYVVLYGDGQYLDDSAKRILGYVDARFKFLDP